MCRCRLRSSISFPLQRYTLQHTQVSRRTRCRRRRRHRLNTIAVLCQPKKKKENKKWMRKEHIAVSSFSLPPPPLSTPEQARKKTNQKRKFMSKMPSDGMQLWAANDGEEENRLFRFRFFIRSFVRYDTKHIIKYKNS